MPVAKADAFPLVFRFTRDFSLLQVRAADSGPAHEALERAGKLDHTVSDCPMYRTPPDRPRLLRKLRQARP
jgi:hypothetical protein